MNNNYLSEDELLEMANVTDVITGIKDVVLWLGPQKNSRNKMIKVCNIPNKISSVDCFTIVVPKFEIVGFVNEQFIDEFKMDKIKEFIIVNQQLIEDYSDYKISTKYFLDGLKSV